MQVVLYIGRSTVGFFSTCFRGEPWRIIGTGFFCELDLGCPFCHPANSFKAPKQTWSIGPPGQRPSLIFSSYINEFVDNSIYVGLLPDMWQAIADCSLVDIFVGITVNRVLLRSLYWTILSFPVSIFCVKTVEKIATDNTETSGLFMQN